MSFDAIRGAQAGLLQRAVFGQLATLTLHDRHPAGEQAVLALVRELAARAQASAAPCGLVAAFAPALWSAWRGRDIPVARGVLDRSPKLRDTGGDVFLYLRSDDAATAAELMESVRPALEKLASHLDIQAAGKRADQKVMAGRYLDGITNPNHPVGLAADVLLAGEYSGASFAFTQKFLFDWHSIATMLPDAQDAMIGRNTEGMALPHGDVNAHVRRVHVLDANGDNLKLLRQALPFGAHDGSAAREKGLMFVGFCNDQSRFEKIIDHMMGPDKDRPADRLMGVVQGVAGSYWYVPCASELGVAGARDQDVVEEAHWQVRSRNGYMFYNGPDYLHQMAAGRYVGGDAPSARLLLLAERTFSHWNDGWQKRTPFPPLPHLKDLLDDGEQHLLTASVALRKGMANKKTLAGLLSSPDSAIARRNGLLRIDAKELIVGVIPDFTLGRGKEVVPYLDEEETVSAWLKAGLNEWSAMGHVVPDMALLVREGVGGVLAGFRARLQAVRQSGQPGVQPNTHPGAADFYQAAICSLEGVQGYLENWALLAERCADGAHAAGSPDDAANMREVAARLRRLRTARPAGFHDGVQLVYAFHCCLHLVGELTAVGRLDQILWPLLEKDGLEPARAQEIIDCLWLKIGENAFVNRANIVDYRTYGTTAVFGMGGNFPQGGGINQWVQQVTVGGYLPTDAEQPTGGANPVTMLCLKAARRIPVSAPTLSLRVYKDMPDAYLDEAARCILAGGAHPILFNDDKLCGALHGSGKDVTLARARDYAADGCYEPMFAGASAFTFFDVAPMSALEQALNQGATYGTAGPVYLRGQKQTLRTPHASQIASFGMLQELFLTHLEWGVVQAYSMMLGAYGNLAGICPSPLLSAAIEGCADSGRDLTDGGALYHIMAPLCIGASNTIDSLYAIKKLVYDPATAVTTLPELLDCLINDWGCSMIEPYQSELLGPADAMERGRRYQQLRDVALALPKWGSGDPDVDAVGSWMMENMVDLCVSVIRNPRPALQKQLDRIKAAYGDFEFVITPGVGTFEGYVGDGLACGASADGRRNGMPIASDLSPAPAPQDLPAAPAFRNIYQSLKSWQIGAIDNGLSNASPVDMNIAEDFPLEDLKQFVKAYARGETGSNLITLTCADPATYQAAAGDPERYNLVRVRMGGWTEFYSAMFPAHQEQHKRRQYFTP